MKNGYLLLAVNNDKQYDGLLKTLGLEALKNDPRFNTWDDRIENEPALRAVIEDALASDDARAWEARLTKGGAPCASIWTIDEIVKHPQLEHRDVLQTVESRFGPMTLVGPGFRLDHGGGRIDTAPATPGQDNDEVLAEAGFSAEEIAQFKAAGVA